MTHRNSAPAQAREFEGLDEVRQYENAAGMMEEILALLPAQGACIGLKSFG
jgi:hypothetical protein